MFFFSLKNYKVQTHCHSGLCGLFGIIQRQSELLLRLKTFNASLAFFPGLHIGGDICKVVCDENSIFDMHHFPKVLPNDFFRVKANFRLDYINPTGCVFR